MYEGASPVLSFFGSPEGRIVKNGSTFEYQYAIADHQGNTRVVFSSVTPAPEAKTANMEAATNTDFFNYTNRVAFNLFDHTDAGTTFTYAQKLTGGNNAQVGVAKSYKVYAGDKVKIEAWAKYQNPTSTSSNLSGFATALLAAFGVPAPGGGETGTASAALNNWGGLVVGGNGGSSSGPKAFVNIIVFDKNYKLLDASWEAVDPAANQVGASPVVAHDYLMKEYTAREEGYVFMYVSNENATLVDVYFDDVVMTLTKGNVIQYNEYYPFGLQTANSWTRENTTGNNFLGNGGTELNTTSQLYDLDYRNYDPVLGRMNGVDPMATKYASVSPYNFAFNDPVTLNDPSGADPYTINYSATNSHYYTAYTYDDRVDYTGLGDYNCSQCWRMEAPGALGGFGPSAASAFYGAASGYGSSVAFGGGSWQANTFAGIPMTRFGQMSADAQAVRNGSMSLEAYASNYGTSYGGGITGLRNGLASLGVTLVPNSYFRMIASISAGMGLLMQGELVKVAYKGSGGIDKNGKGVVGVRVVLGYNASEDEQEEYTKFNWLYTIDTDLLDENEENPSVKNGQGFSSPKKPFYPDGYRFPIGTNGYTTIFAANGLRNVDLTGRKHFMWQAEVSVLGFKDGVWHRLTTATFGWTFDGDNLNLTIRDIKFNISPSSFHLSNIN